MGTVDYNFCSFWHLIRSQHFGINLIKHSAQPDVEEV